MANFEVPVELYMTKPIIVARAGESLEVVRRRLANHRISALPVVDDQDRVVGLISRTDLLRVGRREAGGRHGAKLLTLPDRTAEDEMTREVVVAEKDTPLAETARRMVKERRHRVVVVDSDVPVGIVSTRDLMDAIREKRVNRPLSEIMSSPLFTVRATEPLSLATDRLGQAKVTGLVVVDEGWPVGIFTQEEALGATGFPGDTRVEDAMNPAVLVLDERLAIHRAAAQAAAMDVRRLVVSRSGEAVGIISGLDFARIVAA